MTEIFITSILSLGPYLSTSLFIIEIVDDLKTLKFKSLATQRVECYFNILQYNRFKQQN